MEISSLSTDFGSGAEAAVSVRTSPETQSASDAGTSEKIEGIVTAHPPDPTLSTGRLLDTQA
ncbi:hypothetical protein EHQ12_18005 [Leptospira gomenensis]|uniref:Uncharacterized protein n=1 Tax=Leptospira gomenensis TaxID=2484974 RepID=A0A5F1YD18_9LEPT|nr:hypothetical protein [Leptospira gomenensis]TGK33228.1 hypothetical protein EHQ12_18005 [Leptospira gomenensis]TGK35540.1 hypothetical protein EHQ17_06320 [Leptospira gomenensis]TGK40863.1 hypothetical protein EHQ07_17280 [Leptospira gomenensis]TGK61154.1 hypothetical protein EHQ13_09815 [Leptospira gomenensis]